MEPHRAVAPAAHAATGLSLAGSFFVYAIAFTWAFDRVFGLPASAAKQGAEASEAW